ncbi:hypothetical protein [Streptomyces sp. NPDC046197]|uniref:hypothetical protein n=1 Tax=Streptomyces sp. NPDC046197 TaxID=3154337 RepID=UPI0033FFFD5F
MTPVLTGSSIDGLACLDLVDPARRSPAPAAPAPGGPARRLTATRLRPLLMS